MFGIFRFIETAFNMAISYVTNLINGLLMVLRMVAQLPYFLATMTIFMPAPIIICVSLSVTVAVVLFLLGRQPGG